MKTSKKIDVTIRKHLHSLDHWLVIVTTKRGYSYSCTWADPKPTEEQVKLAWVEDRQSFDPYYS